MKWNDPGRDAYLQMRERASRNERASQGPGKPAERKPWRERVYGGLKGKVTVRTMDVIIGVTIALIALVVIIGIVT